jgi:hypothetical protein
MFKMMHIHNNSVYFSRCLSDALYKEFENISKRIMADFEGILVHCAAP